GEGIEGRLNTCVRFGEDLEQRELHRADGDHPRSMRPPRDRSVTGFQHHTEIGLTPSPNRKISAPNAPPFRRKQPTLCREILHVPVPQREAQLEPDRVLDNRRREPMAAMLRRHQSQSGAWIRPAAKNSNPPLSSGE